MLSPIQKIFKRKEDEEFDFSVDTRSRTAQLLELTLGTLIISILIFFFFFVY